MCEQHVPFLKSSTKPFHDVSVRWDFSQGFIFKTGMDLVGIVNIVVKGEGLEFFELTERPEKHFNNQSLIKVVFLALKPWLMEGLPQNLFKTWTGHMSM